MNPLKQQPEEDRDVSRRNPFNSLRPSVQEALSDFSPRQIGYCAGFCRASAQREIFTPDDREALRTSGVILKILSEHI